MFQKDSDIKCNIENDYYFTFNGKKKAYLKLIPQYIVLYSILYYITSYIDYLPLLHYQAQVHFILPVTGNILSRNIMKISEVTLMVGTCLVGSPVVGSS